MYVKAIVETPVSIGCIDDRCVIVENTTHVSKVEAASFGFKVANTRLYPESGRHQLPWRRSVQEVLATKKSKYVVVRENPQMECALLAFVPELNIVEVSIPKSAVCRVETIHRVAELMGFTKREKEVVLLLSKGSNTKEVASVLGTKISTVRSQIKSVMLKSGFSCLKKFLVFLSCLPEPKDDFRCDSPINEMGASFEVSSIGAY